MKKHAFAFLAVGLLLVAARLVAGCSPAATLKEKQALADGDYAEEQLACVDNAITIEQSRACRAASRLKWDAGLDAAAQDGGK